MDIPKGMKEPKENVPMKQGLDGAIKEFKAVSQSLSKFGRVLEKNFTEVNNRHIATFTIELGGEKDGEKKPTNG